MTDTDPRFPPQSADDIARYADDDVVEGYRDFRLFGVEPGENRAPGYRWGWANAKYDATRWDDGYSWLRHDYIARLKLAS